MDTPASSGNRPQLLFKVTKGTVTVEIRGPRLGWRWRDIQYYRWQKSTKDPAGWDRMPPNRAVDQAHLEQCVQAACHWLRQEDKELEQIHKSDT